MTTPRRSAGRRPPRQEERRSSSVGARILRPADWARTTAAPGHGREHRTTRSVPCDYFDFDVAIEPPLLRLRLYGELDLASAPALDLVHCVLPEDIEVVRIDLTGMRFCDTAGLRALARLCAGAEQRHHVEVVGVQPSLRRIGALTGLAQRWLPA